MTRYLYGAIVLLLVMACGQERSRDKRKGGVSDNEWSNLHEFIPAFVSAVRLTGVPGLTLEQYREVYKQLDRPDTAINKDFAEYLDLVREMNTEVQHYLSDAGPLVYWDTVSYKRRLSPHYLEALMVFPKTLDRNGFAFHRAVRARFVVLDGKVWLFDKMYDTSVHEFYDEATAKLFTSRLFKGPDLYKQKFGDEDRRSQRPFIPHVRDPQLLVTSLPGVLRLTSPDKDDTLAFIRGYPTDLPYIRLDNGHVLTVRNDTTFVLSSTGREIFRTHHAIDFHHAQGYFLLMDVKTRLFGLYDNLTGFYIEPQYQMIQFFERIEAPYAGVITRDGKVAYLDMKGNIMK